MVLWMFCSNGVQHRVLCCHAFLCGCTGHDPEAGDVETKYASMYADKLDPFGAFRSKERESRRAAMALTDRIMYAAGQLVRS